MGQKVLLLALTCLLTACAGQVIVPTSRFIIPEVKGSTGLKKIKAGFAGYSDVQTVSRYNQANVNAASAYLTPGFPQCQIPELGFEFGVLDEHGLDLSLTTDGGYILRALWQLIGSTGDNAQEGGFSIMVTGGFGGSAQYMLGLKQINEGTLEYKQSQTLLDMSMVVGYRFGATTIAYGGPYVTLGNISGTSTVRAAPGAAGTDYAVTSSGNQIGFHLGTQFALSDVFSIILEVAYNQISWQNISMQNQIKGGLSTAFKF